MRPKTAAAFALGLAFGAVCLAVGLWASGAIVAAPPPWKKARVASLPAPAEVPIGDMVASLDKAPPPALPAPEPFESPEAGSPPITAPPLAPAISPTARPGFVGPIAPETPLPTPGPAGRVGPLPDSPARPVGSAPANGARAKVPVGQGDADRIVPDPKLPHLAFPLLGIDPKKVSDTFNDPRGGHPHEALDIMAPRGTPVMAVAQGNVAKLFTSKDGGLTVYQFDDTRTYCFYYAHLDRYAKGIQDGTLLRAGQVLGYVGSTGNASANAPHLHFTLFKLGPEKKWWQGTAINPLPLFQ
jgi:murein DD-endopeptidase MepM/ murein hydrolase activator NlpD